MNKKILLLGLIVLVIIFITGTAFSKYLYILFCHCEEQSDEAIPLFIRT